MGWQRCCWRGSVLAWRWHQFLARNAVIQTREMAALKTAFFQIFCQLPQVCGSSSHSSVHRHNIWLARWCKWEYKEGKRTLYIGGSVRWEAAVGWSEERWTSEALSVRNGDAACPLGSGSMGRIRCWGNKVITTRKRRRIRRRNLLMKRHSLSIGFMIWVTLSEWHITWGIIMWPHIPGAALGNQIIPPAGFL